MSALKTATSIAKRAHRGQTRKWGGHAYFTHPQAVSDAVTGKDAKVVALLHDVVEDTTVMLDDLRQDFNENIVEAVDAISKREGERYWDYIARVKANKLATKVKLADLKHNLSTLPERHGLAIRWEEAVRVLKKR